MMFATCLRILRDAAEAEDVTQDCLEHLAQTRDMPDAPFLGPWLHGIATNKALMRRRSEQRRRDREIAYAESQAQSAESEWSDVAHYVDEAIAELPDDLRGLLLAHYFQGASHRVIAETLDMPRRTVSNRITKGVQLVAENLKRRGITVSTAALAGLFQANLAEAALIPGQLARFIEETLSANSAQTSVQVAATSGVRALIVKVSIGVALIGGAAGMWWAADNDSDRVRNPVSNGVTQEIPRAIQIAQTDRPDDALTQTATDQPAKLTVPEGEAFIHIQVVDAEAVPQGGAKVTIQHWRDPSESDPLAGLATQEVTTDVDGTVIFDRIAEDRYTITARTADAVGYGWIDDYPYMMRRIVVRPVEGATVRAKDGRGNPIVNAQVFLRESRPKNTLKFSPGRHVQLGTTGQDGVLELSVPHGQTWTVQLFAQNCMPVVLDGVIGGSEYDIAMGHGETLAGILHDDSNTPISAARIVAESIADPLDRQFIETDADGRFTFSNLATGGYALTLDGISPNTNAVTLPDHEIIVDAARRSVELTAIDGAEVSGLVRTNNSGLSIANAKVAISRQIGNRRFRKLTRTDSNGRYSFSGIAPGTYRVRVSDTGGSSFINERLEEEITLTSGERRDDVNFKTSENSAVEASVEGTITHNGVPTWAFVAAFAQSGTFPIEITRSDTRGHFRFDEIPATRNLLLRAFRPGLASGGGGQHVLPPEGLRGIALALQPSGSISGRVVGTAGEALEADTYFVNFLNTAAFGIDTRSIATVLADGRFWITELPAGNHAMVVEELDPEMMSTGFPVADATVELGAGEHIKDFVLTTKYGQRVTAKSRGDRAAENERMRRERKEREQRSWGVKGRVIDARTGAPVTAYFLTSFAMGESRHDVSDAEGRFTVDPKDVERTVIRVEAPGYQPSNTFVWPIELQDRHAHVEIALKPGPIIEGVVQNSQGLPVSGARVFPGELPGDFESQHGRFPVTRSNGEFRLETLEAKPQQLFVERIGYPITKVDVAPTLARITKVVITLPAGARIEGLVTENGLPVSNARVSTSAAWHRARQPFVEAGTDGRFVVEHVARGTIRVNAFLPKDDTGARIPRYQTREIMVNDDGTYTANFDFEPCTNTIQGNVTLNGAPADSSSVRVYMQYDDTTESSDSKPSRSGTYELGPLPPGRAMIKASVRTPGANTSIEQEAEVILKNDEALTLDFDFVGSGTIRGTVGNLSPGETVMVYAYVGDVPASRTPVAEFWDVRVPGSFAHGRVEDGRYTLDGLPPGRYSIHAVSQDPHLFDPETPRVAVGTVTMSENAAVELNLSL